MPAPSDQGSSRLWTAAQLQWPEWPRRKWLSRWRLRGQPQGSGPDERECHPVEASLCRDADTLFPSLDRQNRLPDLLHPVPRFSEQNPPRRLQPWQRAQNRRSGTHRLPWWQAAFRPNSHHGGSGWHCGRHSIRTEHKGRFRSARGCIPSVFQRERLSDLTIAAAWSAAPDQR